MIINITDKGENDIVQIKLKENNINGEVEIEKTQGDIEKITNTFDKFFNTNEECINIKIDGYYI